MAMSRGTETRHSRLCRICRSPDRESIERDYVSWERAADICKNYSVRSQTTLYVHVRALRLNEQRAANIRGFLSRFLERGINLKPTAASVIAACTILSKLDAAGKLVDTAHLGGATNPVFEKMTRRELLNFAENGTIPAWLAPEEAASLSQP
jgi:hypothetical protein